MRPVLFIALIHVSITSQHAVKQSSNGELNVHIVDRVLLEQGSEDRHRDQEV